MLQRTGYDKLSEWLRENWMSAAVHLSAVFLLFRIIWLNTSGRFFIDPVRQTITLTGKLAITFLMLSLACTPVNILTGWSKVIRIRKPLGLYSFAFALLHGLSYVGWDYRFNIPLIISNLQYERYILMGVSSFLFLLLLAATSVNLLQKKLGKSWKRLQRLVYLTAFLAVLHVLWLRKSPREVMNIVVILTALLILRVPLVKNGIIKLRSSITKGQE
jgi:sulfoxide reductase heme-binding subunit YedZ